MATFKIEELSVGEETVTTPSHAEKSTQTKKAVGQVGRRYQDHRPRAETEAMIKAAIGKSDNEFGLTFHMIARALERSTSPHLRSIIVAMVERGELVETVDVPNNAKMVRYWYGLP